MKKILEDLFTVKSNVMRGFCRTDEFRKANTMAVESLEALEAALDEENVLYSDNWMMHIPI